MMSMHESIEVPDLHEELNRLWDREQGHNKTRASLFNLILYIQKTEKVSYYQSLIKSVLSKFPSRVMLIVNHESSKEDYLKTTVSSETLGVGEKQIYCEIIQLEVAGKLSERVPFLILPHILPDLPIYLLWTQDPSTESTILPHLESFADRIIFDAESTENLQSYCQTVLSLMNRFHCSIGDLNWSALSGWRTLFAQIFHDRESIHSLSQAETIHIYYNQALVGFDESGSNEGQSLRHAILRAAYLQAWLAARMNWKFKAYEVNEGNIRLTYQNMQQEVIFWLVPQKVQTLPSGAIISVDIESLKNSGHYTFKRHPDNQQVDIQFSQKNLCDLPYSAYLSGTGLGQEIVEELFYPSGSKHFCDTLDILSAIPWRNS